MGAEENRKNVELTYEAFIRPLTNSGPTKTQRSPSPDSAWITQRPGTCRWLLATRSNRAF
jgi:hypothetical protein